MVSTEQINHLIFDLENGQTTHMMLYGYPVVAHLEDSSLLKLSTKVYYGGNYIPQSVRDCIRHPLPTPVSYIPTSLSLDEVNFEIQLHYQGHVDLSNREEFRSLVENFCWIAEEWRFWIDENDKRDLVHVHAR